MDENTCLRCIRCDKELENVSSGCTNQPHAGTAFTTHGHYGSTIFDPMDGQYLEINVCDDCLKGLSIPGTKNEHVLLGRNTRRVVCRLDDDLGPCVVGQVKVAQDYEIWTPGLEHEKEDDLEIDEIKAGLMWGTETIEFFPHLLETDTDE